MKSILLSLCLFVFIYSEAQEPVFRDYTSVSQTIDISEYQNQAFRLSAALKLADGNGNESWGIWAYIENKEESGSYLNDMDSKEVADEWKRFTLEGKIDSSATTLTLGFLAEKKAQFYADDMKLEIQKQNGKWKSIEIEDPGFEQTTNPAAIWKDSTTLLTTPYTSSLTTESAYKGKHSLLISSENMWGQNDDQGGFIEVNGVKLYYEMYGEGEPLLLLHGAGQSISAFHHQLDFFTPHYQVIALDSRGRGRSTDNEDILTYKNQALDTKLFLDALKLDSVNIVGWSDGGIIGLIMAMDYPAKVNKLVAFGANIHPDGLFPERLATHKKNYARLVELNKPEHEIYRKMYNALINYPQLEMEALKVVEAPTLIMAGDHDVIQDEHTVDMFQAIPNSNLAILPGETHWMPSANPKLFNKTVLDFLQKRFEEPKRW